MNRVAMSPMVGMGLCLDTPAARWRRRLRDGTGRGLRIGILDTGVADHLPELRGAIRSHHTIADDGRAVRHWRGDDALGHGTACAWILRGLAPEAELHSVRIFGRSPRERGGKLIAGLAFALDQGWDVINISLGSTGFREELMPLVRRAGETGRVIVAAAHNEPGGASFPAQLPGVIGVDGGYFESPLGFRYHPGRLIEVEARGVYVEAPRPDGSWFSYTGSSFACPHVSAIVARLGRERIGEKLRALGGC